MTSTNFLQTPSTSINRSRSYSTGLELRTWLSQATASDNDLQQGSLKVQKVSLGLSLATYDN